MLELNMEQTNEKVSNIAQFFKKLRPRLQPEPKDATPTRAPRIGLALGCGGAQALVHIGVIKALEDHGIKIHAVSGCSMGAYIGALWASGMTAEEMINKVALFQDKKALKKMADPAVPPIRGLFYGNLVKEHLRQYVGTPKIEDLKRQYIAIAANLDNYQRVVFNKGDLLSAVHASCAMPGIVVPVEVNGIRCVDGGVVDPVPVGALRDYTDVDLMIAVSTTPSLSDIESADPAIIVEEMLPELENESWFKSKINMIGQKYNPAAQGNMLDTLRRSLKASQIRLAQESCKRADLTIHPITENSKWDDFANYEHFIEEGAKATLEVMDQIKKLTDPIPDTEERCKEMEFEVLPPE